MTYRPEQLLSMIVIQTWRAAAVVDYLRRAYGFRSVEVLPDVPDRDFTTVHLYPPT